jgi:hypothetical protein
LQRNKYDKKDCLELGILAEDAFKKVASKRGWLVTESTRSQNMHQHIDCIIEKDGHAFNVDVKSLRRRTRWDDEFELEWTWVEFHGVRESDPGWLFGGNAQLFAFEQPAFFIIIDRENLQRLAVTLVDTRRIARNAPDAKYAVYNRPGRNDIISMIETQHIIDNCWDIWER